METLHQNTSPEPIPAGAYMRGWQQTGLRMFRAQERMLQGITKAAKLELKYGQDLATSRLDLLEWTATDPNTRANQAVRELESLMTMLRDVTEALNDSFMDVARLMAKDAESQLDETIQESQEALEKGFEKARDMARKGADASAGLAGEGIQGIQDAMPDESE